ncbi:MAG: PEGA domain-containing protein [Polyangiales bacterium]
MKPRARALLAFALVGLTASRADAQPVSTRARAHFARGVTAADEGRAEAAMVEFSRVWELTHDPFVLFNIAVTHEALGHDGDALDAMERYERESPPLPPARRAAVDAALRRLRARVATLALRLPVDSARVHVGGAIVTASAARAGVRLPSGVHRVEISAPGFRPYETTIELAGGDRVVLDARLEPVRAPLAVECDVPGAEVLVDGERVGDTPMVSAALVPEGLHRVEVRRAGYATFTAAVEVQAAGSGCAPSPVGDARRGEQRTARGPHVARRRGAPARWARARRGRRGLRSAGASPAPRRARVVRPRGARRDPHDGRDAAPSARARAHGGAA